MLILGTLAARADLVAATSAGPLQRTGQAATFADPAALHGRGLLASPSQPLLNPVSFGDPLGASAAVAESFEPEPEQLTTLPPAPDSAVLALSGLLSLGAVQLGRNVRKLHLGTLPQWYHDGGPAQVGHATPLDLEFSLSAMPICRFEAPVAAGDEERSPWWWLRLEPRDRLDSQYFLLSAEPRGPPLLSS